MDNPFILSRKEVIALELFKEHHEKCRGSVEDSPPILSLTITNTQTGSFVVVKCEKCKKIKIISDKERIQDAEEMAARMGINIPIKRPSYMAQSKD
jgi:hypothetical protein